MSLLRSHRRNCSFRESIHSANHSANRPNYFTFFNHHKYDSSSPLILDQKQTLYKSSEPAKTSRFKTLWKWKTNNLNFLLPRFITFCKLYWPRSNFNTEEIQWICSMYVSVETTKLHYIFFHVLISKQKRAFILSSAIFLITITRVRAITSPWKLYFKISLITLFPTHWKFFSKKLQFVISLLMENVTFKIVSMIVRTQCSEKLCSTQTTTTTKTTFAII